jgi:hypothetical protein
MHQESDLQKIGPDLTIFSLARHGRAGEVEALLQRFPADTRDEFGNTLLMVACQVRDTTCYFPLFFRFPPYPVFSFPHYAYYYSIREWKQKKCKVGEKEEGEARHRNDDGLDNDDDDRPNSGLPSTPSPPTRESTICVYRRVERYADGVRRAIVALGMRASVIVLVAHLQRASVESQR